MAKTVDQMVTIVADAVGKSENASSISGALFKDRCVDFLNWGQERIARHYSFHELNTYTESAVTVADVKRYPLVSGTNNLGLTRPKDVQSIRLIDSENSRTLERWSPRRFDKLYPRPENFATARPSIYIRWGNEVEVFKIPDAAYTLHIRYPQWPSTLVAGSGTTDYENKDQLLITAGILEGYLHLEEYNDAKIWLAKFVGLLTDAVRVEGDIDWEPAAQPFSLSQGGRVSGEPWLDPFGTEGDPLFNFVE